MVSWPRKIWKVLVGKAVDETTRSGVSTSGSYDWTTVSPTDGWEVSGVNVFAEETGGAQSVKIKVVATNKNSPASPSGSDPDDWPIEVVEETTISAGSGFAQLETTRADQIAVGLIDGSGSGTVDWEVELMPMGGVSRLLALVEDVIGGSLSFAVDLSGDSLSGNLDVDLAEQTLAQLTATLEGDDQAGNTAGVQAEELSGTIAGSETAIFTMIARALASVGLDELLTRVPSDYESGSSVDAPDSYESPGSGPDSVEITRVEPGATVIVSAYVEAGTGATDFQVREAPEAEGTMATGSDGWHQLDETLDVGPDASYKKRFDLSGRALNFRFKDDGNGGAVDYDVTRV